jgi:regulator of cell morphogenesis and NO signaling
MTHTPHPSDAASTGVVLADLAAARVADLAREYPASIRVFQRNRIDFCCGGRKSVAEAAGRAGVDPAGLIGELEAALAAPGAGDTWLCALPQSLGDLGKLIVGRYHVALRSELPRLVAMADRVEHVHGAELPQILPQLAATVRALAVELDAHMREEEDVVFPAIERLERAVERHQAAAPSDLSTLVAAREDEHAAAGEHLRALRRLSADFNPPDWACNTFRGLYHGLAELERDLHEHIHLENNVLFPRALETAAQVVA